MRSLFEDAVLVNADPVLARSGRVARVKGCDDMHPGLGIQRFLKIGPRAFAAVRVEDVGGNSVGPAGVLAGIEAECPILLFRLGVSFAEPVDIILAVLAALEIQGARLEPNLDAQALAAVGLAETLPRGNLDISVALQLDRSIRIVHDGAGDTIGDLAAIMAIVLVTRFVMCGGSFLFSQPPVANRMVRQNGG